MQSQTSKIVLAVIITALVVGSGVYFWQSSLDKEPDIVTQEKETKESLKTYSSEKYSFKYPKNYTLEKNFGSGQEDDPLKILTIKNTKGRLEIFQMENFSDRPLGFEGTETQEDIDGYVPKENFTVGTGDKKYDVWLYYSKNDSATKAELHKIFESIEVK